MKHTDKNIDYRYARQRNGGKVVILRDKDLMKVKKYMHLIQDREGWQNDLE